MTTFHERRGSRIKFNFAMATLGGTYDRLAEEINTKLSVENVYITEYPSSLTDEDGKWCDGDENFQNSTLLWGIAEREVQWISESFVTPLNQNIKEAVDRQNAKGRHWNFVGGISQDYFGHGFCSSDNWVRTAYEAAFNQGPLGNRFSPTFGSSTGTMHPNPAGYDVYKRHIKDAISRTTSPGPTFVASEPEHTPGRAVVRITATDPSGIAFDSVSVNATGGCQVEGVTCTTRRPDGQSLEWTLEVTKEGLHSFEFVAKNGNDQASSFVHEVEYLPPPPPSIDGPTDNSYDTDGSVTFFGAAEAGSTINLFEEGNPEPVSSATADGSNAWSLTLTGVAEGTHSYTATATNSSGLTSVASAPVRVTVDTTKPAITVNSPTEGASYKQGMSLTAEYTCTDNTSSGSDLSCTGSVPNGSALDTISVGPKTFTVTSTDKAGNAETKTINYSVVYDFGNGSGGSFGEPVRETELNQVKAGAGVPVKFGLGGDFGLNIFATGYPTSKKIACNTGLPVDQVEETVAITNSGLKYDAVAGHYVYGWKTDKSWSGTCRELNVMLADGTDHLVKFQFK